MNKKITFLFIFFLSFFFVKAQNNNIPYNPSSQMPANTAAHDLRSEILTEEIINKKLETSKQNGVKESELAIYNRLLHKRMQEQIDELNNPKIGATNRGSQPPILVNTSGCLNPGFENGTNSNWTFASGNINGTNLPCNTCPSGAAAINTIVNSASTVAGQCAAGVDTYGNFPVVAPAPLGGTYSLLLNNASAGGKIQEAKYTFAVTAANVDFTFQYAAVLQSGSHPPNEQPYFHVDATSSCSGLIPCTEYDVNAPTSGALAGWSISTVDNSVYYKPWTTVTLDLSSSIGCNVTVSFIVSDCNQGGHFGYAYIDASCSPNTVTLTKALCQGGGPAILTGPPGLASYHWAGPVTGNAQSLSTSTPGTYTLTTTSTTGCPSPTLTYILTQNPAPVPAFTYTSPPCSGTETFTDGSTVSAGSIVNWHWNYGDGSAVVNATTGANQTHTYNPPGNYVVTLTDSTAAGCLATYSFTVNAGGGGPTPAFTSNSTAAAPQCFTGNNVVFTNTSTATGSVTVTGYNWDYGDGQTGTSTVASPNSSHSYTSCGTFVVTLTVNVTGCSATTTQTVVINPSPTASFTVAPVCRGVASVFVPVAGVNAPCTSASYTYNWNFGDAGTSTLANPSHIYVAAPTSFPVTLTVTAVGGCSVTATGTAVINPSPVASFTVPQVCQGTASVFDASACTPAGSITSYTWNFGGAAPNTDIVTTSSDSHIYQASGTFPVTLTISAVGGCTATATGSAIVNTMAVLSITTTPACDLSAVVITNNTPAQGTFTLWAWDMGDGIGTSTVAAPGSYTYPAPGIYTVTLNASTSTGCSGTATTTAVVHPNPDFDGQISQACFGDQSGMYDLSTITNPAGLNDVLATWNWDFGDGYTTTTTVDSAIHVYTNCGNYTASYTVSTNFNCAVAASGTATVFCLPVVTAPPSFSICPGTPVTTSEISFTTTCAAPALTTPHAFYFVNNPSFTTNTTATHGGIPLADTAGLDAIPAYTAIAQNLSCGLLVDTVYGYAATPYLDANNQVQVGCVGNVSTFTISVYPTPTVTPTSDISVCANQVVNVPNFTGCPTPETFTWSTSGDNVGLGATGAGNMAPFTGINTTTVAATQAVAVTPLANGCFGSVSNFNIIVSPLPTMTVTTPAPYCPGDNVSTPSINMAVGTVLTWTVSNPTNIGMTTPGTGIPLPYTAPANASLINQVGVITYTPTLNGCVGTPATETITIYPTPIIQPITSQSLCPGVSTSLVNANISPVPSATDAVVWTYPAGALPASVNGTVFPPIGPLVNPGLSVLNTPVTVTYSVNGCAGLPTSFNIYVYPTPQPSFSATSVCQGQTTIFTDLSLPNSGSNPINQWNWDMNNDGIYDVSGIENPSYTLSAAGINQVKLFVSTASPACSDTITLPVTVYPNPIPNFVADTLSGCPTLPVVFRDTSTVAAPSVITSYVWNFGNGNTSNVKDPLPAQQYTNPSATAVKSYSVSLTVISTGGCTATITKAHYINVSPTPIADFSWGPTDTDIDAPSITFVNQAIGAGPYVPVTYGPYGVHYYLGDIYAANPNSNNVDNNTTFGHVYEYYQPETYSVTQWVVNNLGCKDSITKEVVILPNFTFYIPNAFSPNGDGTNEGFKGTGVGIKEGTYNLWVFDRWGNMLFYADDLEKAWDGHMKGNSDRPILQEDVYVWKVNFHDFTGKRHDFHGTVTLLK